MATKIQVKRDTAANWSSVDPVLSAGEPGLATDTGVVKYGDGKTSWNNLTAPPSGDSTSMTAWSGNQWHYHSSSGGKSFIFKTAGHVRTNVRVTSGQSWNDTTGFEVKVSEHPKIIDSVKTAYDGWQDDYQSRPYFYINGYWSGHIDHYTLDGDTMTIYSTWSHTLNVNDTIQFAGWNYGTQANFATYVSDVAPNGSNLAYDGNYWQPKAAVANTNTFTVDLTGMITDDLALLNSGSGKNYVVFDAYSNNNGRRITAVANTGSVYTITVSGEPVTLKKKTTKTLLCRPAVSYGGYQLLLSTEEYPQLIDYLNTPNGSDGAYFTVNGGEPIPVYYFWPRGGNDSQNDGVTYYGHWALGTNTYMEYNPQDTIELHYVEKGTFIRFDLWTPNGTLGDPHPSSSNHGYRWFSWEEDLPHFKDARGNGVQGGWIDYHVQATWPDTSSRNWDNRTFSVFFDPKGYDYDTGDVTGLNNFRYQGFPTFSGPGQPNNYGGGAFGGPWYNLEFQTMWDFYEDGIFFHAYHNNYDNNTQQEVKIDIMWNARIFYADTPMLEPSDR